MQPDNGIYVCFTSPWNYPGQNTGVGSLSLLQGIFPIQRSNPDLPPCRRILYQLSHKGSPKILEWVTYPFSSISSQPRNQTGVSCIAGVFFTNWAMREANNIFSKCKIIDAEKDAIHLTNTYKIRVFYNSSVGKESACNAGDLDLIPGWGRSPGERKDYPLQYSGLENSMDCIVHGVTKSQTWLSDFYFTRFTIK